MGDITLSSQGSLLFSPPFVNFFPVCSGSGTQPGLQDTGSEPEEPGSNVFRNQEVEHRLSQKQCLLRSTYYVRVREEGECIKLQNMEFPLWYSGLRIWHCYKCGSGCSCSSDMIPGPGTSICCECGQKKNKTKTKQNQKTQPNKQNLPKQNSAVKWKESVNHMGNLKFSRCHTEKVKRSRPNEFK